MSHRPYPKLLDFIEDDIGIVFDANSANVRAMAEKMHWEPWQVLSVLSVLAAQGVLWLRRRHPVKRWQLADHVVAAPRRGRPQTTKAPEGADRLRGLPISQ